MKVQKSKEKKGITLIALIVTIIILLVLSGITLSNLTNKGIFSKANEAATKYKTSQLEEKIELAKLEIEMSSNNKSINDVLI